MTAVETRLTRLRCDDEVVVPIGLAELAGRLRIPESPLGIVIFAHGSGTMRNNPRNRYTAGVLSRHRLATLTIDLLTSSETYDAAKIFDVERLGCRITAVRDWLRDSPLCQSLPVGYLGTGSDAPATLWAAAEPRDAVRAVAIRGGRPDLAGARLTQVMAPTLFLLGGHDRRVRVANQRAASAMRCEHRITELSAPGRAWAEPRLSRWAAYLATVWFSRYLTTDPLVSCSADAEFEPTFP